MKIAPVGTKPSRLRRKVMVQLQEYHGGGYILKTNRSFIIHLPNERQLTKEELDDLHSELRFAAVKWHGSLQA